jgi:DNA (cytosine-5)-methyltransferase 1
MENVPGLLSVDGGRTFGRILEEMAEIGYCVQWNCVPASAVGSPHQRDRVWILAHASGVRHEEFHLAALVSRARQFTRRVVTSWNNWETEPAVGRVADGIPHRLDRLRGLGNSIVPQVAFIFASAIYQELTR